MDVPEGEFKRMEALISSMTLDERSRPEIIDNSRRFRIARGSGCSVAEVNALLKQYNEMKRLFGGKGGFGAAMKGVMAMLQGGKAPAAQDMSDDRLRRMRENRDRKREERKKRKKQQKKHRRR